jgi:hypothetical protein
MSHGATSHQYFPRPSHFSEDDGTSPETKSMRSRPLTAVRVGNGKLKKLRKRGKSAKMRIRNPNNHHFSNPASPPGDMEGVESANEDVMDQENAEIDEDKEGL